MTRARDNEKQDRLARALRDNLRRRKAAARQGTENSAPDAYPGASDPQFVDKAAEQTPQVREEENSDR